MPSFFSFRRVVLVWLLRAWAVRRWRWVIFLAVFSSHRAEAGWSVSHHDRTSAAIAVCSWHTVHSGFFPPVLPHLSQEQVTDRRNDQLALKSPVAAPRVLIQADCARGILKTTRHPPARKGHPQQGPPAGFGRRVPDEELDLFGIQDIVY